MENYKYHSLWGFNLILSIQNIRNEPISGIMTDLMTKEEIVRNLPPGGGIHAKQAYLEALIAEKWPDLSEQKK